MLSCYLFYSTTLCWLPWRSKQPSSLAMKRFWCLKSPSKISGFNNFPLALLPFETRRMKRTQKHNTSKLLSAQQSRVAASGSLLARPPYFPQCPTCENTAYKCMANLPICFDVSAAECCCSKWRVYKGVPSSVALKDLGGVGSNGPWNQIPHEMVLASILLLLRSWRITSVRSLRKMQ